jgi:hypothetical protein
VAFGDLIISNDRLGVGTTENLSTLTVRASGQFNLAGTLATTDASTTVTGTGTRFLSELAIGDRIIVDESWDGGRAVVAIASDLSLTVDRAYQETQSGLTVLAAPSSARFDDGTGATTVVVTDQGSIGVGTLGPRASVDIAGMGAGGWRGCSVNLRIHTPEFSDAWGIVMTTELPDPTPCEQGAAIWLDHQPEAGGSTLNFTLIDADDNEMDPFRIDGTGVAMLMGLTVNPTLVNFDYGLGAGDYHVYVDAEAAGHTITLPDINACYGKVYCIYKSAGAGSVAVAPFGSDTINGVAGNRTISTAFSGIKFVALSNTWFATPLAAL